MPVAKVYPPKLNRKQKLELEKQERTERAMREKAAADAARQQARDAKANAHFKKEAAEQAEKAAYITRVRNNWNVQINAVVKQVLKLRADNPDRAGVNAGANAGLQTTDGGTGNPLPLVLPNPNPGVAAREILGGMTGFDNSDSGLYKFRRSGVLVHCC